MSRSINASLLIAAAATMTPGAARAQSITEAALLNRLAPTIYVPTGFASGSGAEFPDRMVRPTGERALLGRTALVTLRDPDAQEAAGTSRVTGSYALLGVRTPSTISGRSRSARLR